MKHVLEHDDVYPGLVVGHNHVPALRIEVFKPFHIPLDAVEHLLDQIVDGNPTGGDGCQQASAGVLNWSDGKHGLDQCNNENGDTADNRVEQV